MLDTPLSQRLESLLSEPLEVVRRRQQHSLEQLIGGLDSPFVLFGASHLGRKALVALKQMGFVPRAFIDNNPAVWGTEIDAVPVMSPTQLAEQDKDNLPSVICTIWSGHISDRMSDRLVPLRQRGFKRIALFGHLAWRYPDTFLPHYSLDLPEKVILQAEQVRRAFSLLCDEQSRQMFVDHVEWRLSLDHDLLPIASARQIYFDDHFSTRIVDEVIYDVGAFDGDTVKDYLSTGRGYREIHCFEPEASNYSKLTARLAQLSLSNVHAHSTAVGDCAGESRIEAEQGASSRVGHGDQVVRMTTLDQMSTTGLPPTFIKIDIEGFEPQCLAGGRRVISECHPVIAVCVYHEQDHLWSIPLQLHEYYPHYHFSLCPHLAEGWDLVLYAVPKDRLPT
ncbi:hypothetical protein BXT89_00375 [Halopseudomonas pachastrellae]|uniref:Methyltransferase FkbM domain-containing protein n=1 Tax=Halopseudomonas pachastrellae TaxID=254161 RepID=A0A1S8DK34_9GAMM|nr:FkbM family methyltransferase [Halopseudomonas pachastrellae]ONM45788.1 hypothetical protein BXT89_00375 [Halopseudomonas pachastrellae]SFL99641.1 methyltransferase, FkbM family [Halopseudomonas pachastrellae]